MSNPITISLIAPIYGVERYIAQFADSVLSQSYPYIEYIFVNDGTKDRSIDILEGIIEQRYSRRKEQITIVHKENGGLPAARKTGLEHATGDYIYHVDSDDWLAEGAIETIVKTIEATNSDVVYFNYVKEYEGRSKIKPQRCYSGATKWEYIRDMYNHKTPASVWNKCIKRTLYADYTIYTPKYSYAEDCYLNAQLVGYASTITHIDKTLYHYRKGNPNAITRQAYRRRKREYALNFMDLYEKYRDVPADKNPVAVIFDDMLIQAGWYSILYRLRLFRDYPYLAQQIVKAKVREGNVWLVGQWITKLYARLR